MRLPFLLISVASGLLLCAGPAQALPPGFPDVDSYPAVDPADYEVFGAHPSMSGWVFSTPSGLRCQSSLIADLGVFCQSPGTTVGVSLTKQAEFGEYGGAPDENPSRLLPTGSKIAATNGVVCAALDDDTLACRATKPDWWPADTVDPPDRHYGDHGFVVGPEGSWGF